MREAEKAPSRAFIHLKFPHKEVTEGSIAIARCRRGTRVACVEGCWGFQARKLALRKGNALVFLWCAILLACGNSSAASLPKVIRYELQVRINPEEEQLTAAAQITISNSTATASREIPFLLYRLLTVNSLEDEHGAPLAFSQAVVPMSDEKNWQVNAVSVRFRKPLAPGKTAKILLSYRGAIFGYREIMRYVQDHIGEDYTLLRPDALAYPMLASPSSQSLNAAYDTLFTYDLQITVPSGTIVACGGVSRGVFAGQGTQTFEFASHAPTWRIDIAAAKFQVLKSDAGNLVVYVLPGDEGGGSNLLKEMQRVTEFYASRFGPSKKATAYTVIEVPEGWGSQASDFYILLAAGAFKDPKRVYELYHEIGHSWNAKAKSEVQRTRWFDEAFASYFEALALREFVGQKAFNDEMDAYRQRFRNDVQKDARNATTPIAEYGKEELGENSYTKGAWSLFVLHQVVGDERFNQMIRGFLEEFFDRPADFRDFQDVATRVSKRDLSRFFQEWIFDVQSSQLLLGNSSAEEIVARYREAPPS